MTSGDELMRIENLSLWVVNGKKRIQIIHDASFSVRAGQRWGIAGESGAGKSMMTNAIAALLPDGSTEMSGKVLYRLGDGTWQDLLELPYADRQRFVSKRVAFIFQDSIHALNPNERIARQWGDTVKLHHGNLSKAEAEDHILAKMKTFGIRGERDTLRSYPHQLSGGMRQRIAIAMALESQSGDTSLRPGGIVIADEPTTALDTVTQRSVVDYIKGICERNGKTLLYVSHNLGILQYLCDHLMVMKDGRIVEQGAADSLFSHAQASYTKQIIRETMKVMGREGARS